MRVRRGCHIDGVDVRIVNQLVGIVIPTRNAVSSGVVSGEAAASTHHRHQLRALRPLKARPALAFSYLPDTDDSPSDPLHGRQRTRGDRPSIYQRDEVRVADGPMAGSVA